MQKSSAMFSTRLACAFGSTSSYRPRASRMVQDVFISPRTDQFLTELILDIDCCVPCKRLQWPQVVERLVLPVCAAHGCRYPEAPEVAPQLLPSGCKQQQQYQPTPQQHQQQAAAQPEGDAGPFRSTSPDWPLSPQPPWGLSALSSPPSSCSHSYSCSAPWTSASEVSSSVPGRSSTTHMSTCTSANLGSASVCGSEAWTRSNAASSSGTCSIAASRTASGAVPSNAPAASTAPASTVMLDASPQAAAAATAAAGALPMGQLPGSSLPYLYVVHAWDCCFAELVSVLSAQMAGVPVGPVACPRLVTYMDATYGHATPQAIQTYAIKGRWPSAAISALP